MNTENTTNEKQNASLDAEAMRELFDENMEHPSSEKRLQLETVPSPMLEQSAPLEVKALRELFEKDMEKALEIYRDKRFDITGIASKVGLDIHNKPSVELSEKIGGKCHAICIFPSEDILSQVTEGEKVTIRANFLVFSNLFGVIMKLSELVEK